ncbi:uncharacterized protein DUF4333 [Prauserella shujinwangii]|uniref:Uncharacterized protein DUF4333 n=1 Tax=Prauserella shujinwangii TaxID=1453103 RepID=A0A2T0LP69_9PSEU|nr:DUF4333 domain-containing protein [Prauserella shujinwangii]PRX45050.1 uncharacterized protein DUF4333 [Prauserella shujinwangii]
MVSGAALVLLLVGACARDDVTPPETSPSAPGVTETVTATELADDATTSAPSPTTTTAITKVFNAAVMENDVQRLLTESYEVRDVRSVDCPADQEVEPGNTFDCDALIGGEPHTVTITVTDAEGRYEVGQPEPA